MRSEASSAPSIARYQRVGDSGDKQQTDKSIGRTDGGTGDKTTASAVRAAAEAAAAIIDRKGGGGRVDIEKVALQALHPWLC